LGRATLELARHFDRVTGVDFSARFVGAAAQIAEQGELRYVRADEGDLVTYCERRIADLGLSAMREKVEFLQGDACNLKPHFTGYDLVLAANLVDRLYSPKRFLEGIHERVKPGGLLIVTSPYTWLAEHTPREEWIGGFKRDGESVTTLDGLKTILGRHFRRIGEPPLGAVRDPRDAQQVPAHAVGGNGLGAARPLRGSRPRTFAPCEHGRSAGDDSEPCQSMRTLCSIVAH
jgi:putative 4-mercaptohistidine N1-methyltranferase